ncbi:L7Ae/L30e/S12e/Gadd45 family ribosomal protein [Breznakia pachnodae]|jgi:ribosomal protein L7Ae-like RNA K-turn-binding protein|uniref:Ribosomal protein L7Ae-like RNA K-turn-binding protein n=1 Tax=Breznakia pachnodae TaxID=265178 RepID=A0ABU0E4D1_9FIRM|nr:ribosomal L7Ae/L30e/S12e/Gadd45 family protein [Breznakia pachnodae]MDQ0361676.1 ribosomal protein L7Ae-like RNA K-turn-binding protein [Breznakia pachnodae]
MNSQYGIFGLAAASRKISIGETLIKEIRAGRCKYVVIAEDASDNTKKRITDKCTYYHVKYGFIESSEELSNAVGKHNIKAVGILDQGFAKKISEILKG